MGLQLIDDKSPEAWRELSSQQLAIALENALSRNSHRATIESLAEVFDEVGMIEHAAMVWERGARILVSVAGSDPRSKYFENAKARWAQVGNADRVERVVKAQQLAARYASNSLYDRLTPEDANPSDALWRRDPVLAEEMLMASVTLVSGDELTKRTNRLVETGRVAAAARVSEHALTAGPRSIGDRLRNPITGLFTPFFEWRDYGETEHARRTRLAAAAYTYYRHIGDFESIERLRNYDFLRPALSELTKEQQEAQRAQYEAKVAIERDGPLTTADRAFANAAEDPYGLFVAAELYQEHDDRQGIASVKDALASTYSDYNDRAIYQLPPPEQPPTAQERASAYAEEERWSEAGYWALMARNYGQAAEYFGFAYELNPIYDFFAGILRNAESIEAEYSEAGYGAGRALERLGDFSVKMLELLGEVEAAERTHAANLTFKGIDEYANFLSRQDRNADMLRVLEKAAEQGFSMDKRQYLLARAAGVAVSIGDVGHIEKNLRRLQDTGPIVDTETFPDAAEMVRRCGLILKEHFSPGSYVELVSRFADLEDVTQQAAIQISDDPADLDTAITLVDRAVLASPHVVGAVDAVAAAVGDQRGEHERARIYERAARRTESGEGPEFSSAVAQYWTRAASAWLGAAYSSGDEIDMATTDRAITAAKAATTADPVQAPFSLERFAETAEFYDNADLARMARNQVDSIRNRNEQVDRRSNTDGPDLDDPSDGSSPEGRRRPPQPLGPDTSGAATGEPGSVPTPAPSESKAPRPETSQAPDRTPSSTASEHNAQRASLPSSDSQVGVPPAAPKESIAGITKTAGSAASREETKVSADTDVPSALSDSSQDRSRNAVVENGTARDRRTRPSRPAPRAKPVVPGEDSAPVADPEPTANSDGPARNGPPRVAPPPTARRVSLDEGPASPKPGRTGPASGQGFGGQGI